MTGRRTITQARGDVTGDGIPDRVWLSGYQETEGGMWQGIQLRIQDGASCRETRLSLPEDTGYNPRLTLCPLTGRDRMDILTSVDSGGSGIADWRSMDLVCAGLPDRKSIFIKEG